MSRALRNSTRVSSLCLVVLMAAGYCLLTTASASDPGTGEWYRVKLRVENLPGGQVRARGKVWPAGAAEPEAWTIERTDPIGNRQGSPGIFGSALAEIYFDNLKVYPNK